MANLKPDLHRIYNQGDRIETKLNRVMKEVVYKRIKLVKTTSVLCQVAQATLDPLLV